jgi:GTP cyclohydrolase IA
VSTPTTLDFRASGAFAFQDMAKKEADPARAAKALREFLRALGFDAKDPALATTPETAATAFAERLLDGYRMTPGEALGAGFPVKNSGSIVATRIPLMFVCPHHLMPAQGVAHVAFVPRGRVPGLGRIAKLCDTLAHRLILQEDLTGAIAHALADHLDAEAALAIVEARHLCVAIEDPARRDTIFRTRAAVGSEEVIASLASEIDASLASSWPTSASKPPSRTRDSKSQSRRPQQPVATQKKRTTSAPRRRSRSDDS